MDHTGSVSGPALGGPIESYHTNDAVISSNRRGSSKVTSVLQAEHLDPPTEVSRLWFRQEGGRSGRMHSCSRPV